MAQSIQILTIIILCLTSLIIFLIVWACMILLHGSALWSFFNALLCTCLIILTAWGFLRPIDPACFNEKLKNQSELFSVNIFKKSKKRKKEEEIGWKRIDDAFKRFKSYFYPDKTKTKTKKKKETYNQPVDSILANYVPGGSADDVFLTQKLNPVDQNDLDYQLIASDEKIETTAENNVQKQIEAQPNIIDSNAFKDEIYNEMLDRYINTVQLDASETVGKSDDKIKSLKIQKLGLSMRDLHEKIFMNELNYSNNDMMIFYNQRYIKYLTNADPSDDEFSIKLDAPPISKDEQDNLSYIGIDSSDLFESTEDKIEYLEKLRNINEQQSKNYKEQMKSEFIRKNFKDLIDTTSASKFDEQRQKLVEDEVDNLQDIRLRTAVTYNSQGLLENEYKNPYTILPKDLWYRPAPGAKDIINGKSCNCPVQMTSDNINFYPVS